MTTALRDLLPRVVQLFDASGVAFMIAGSVASTTYGLARSTQDIDVVIDPPNLGALETLVKSMPSDAYYADLEAARDAWHRRSMFNVVDFASGWKLDLILRKNRPFSREEFARRVQTTLLDVPVFIASAEDTVVAKLEWSKLAGGSERQRRDVAGIIAATGADLDRGYIERWVGDLALSEEWAAARAATP